MTDTVIAALITGGLALIGVIVSCLVTIRKSQEDNQRTKEDIQAEIKTAIAVQDTKIEELTREVREHNNFARRMPVVENEIRHIENDITTLKHYHE